MSNWVDMKTLRAEYPLGKALLYRLAKLLPHVLVGEGRSTRRLISRKALEEVLEKAARERRNIVEISKMDRQAFLDWLKDEGGANKRPQ